MATYHHYYVLRGQEAVPVDFADWKLQPTRERRVARDEVGGLTVSTVFLGINHSFGLDGPPLLFETIVFGTLDEPTVRYSTWDEAVAGHAAVVAGVKR